MRYSELLEPITVGSERLKNRIGLAPISTGMIDEAGHLMPAFAQFHNLYATTGAAAIFIGGVGISEPGRVTEKTFVLDAKDKVSELSPVVQSIRTTGATPIIQLMHAGRQSWINRDNALAPSRLPCPILGTLPREATLADISNVIDHFRRSAELARSSGITLAEIHAAHGYLLSGFLSPYTNKRTDRYGGSLLNRFRIIAEVLDAVCSVRGLSIGIRLSCDERVPGGLTAEDIPYIFQLLRGQPLSFISVSAGTYNATDYIMPSRKFEEAIYRNLGLYAKAHSSVPVMLAGNITSLDSATMLLRDKAADIVLFGRAFLSDAGLVRKSLSGLESLVVPCSMCRLCKYTSRSLPHVVCPHNPGLKEIFKSTISSLRQKGIVVRSKRLQ